MVRVEPVRPEWAQALAEGDAVFAERFGIPVEAGWSGFPEALPILFEATKTGSVSEWGPHLFFDDDGALVGNGGWKGPPAEGVAELGYAVASSWQRRGSQRQSSESSSNALAEENASAKVLQRCGFTRTAELIDPDEGPVWRWELQIRP